MSNCINWDLNQVFIIWNERNYILVSHPEPCCSSMLLLLLFFCAFSTFWGYLFNKTNEFIQWQIREHCWVYVCWLILWSMPLITFVMKVAIFRWWWCHNIIMLVPWYIPDMSCMNHISSYLLHIIANIWSFRHINICNISN